MRQKSIRRTRALPSHRTSCSRAALEALEQRRLLCVATAIGCLETNPTNLCDAPNTSDAASCAATFETMSMHNHADHEAVMALVPLSSVTHVAVVDGNWSQPSTWQANQVPGNGSRVHIPAGRSIVYDANDANPVTPLSLRVDGTLSFATDRSTRMNVDTIVVTETGTLNIGTIANPLAASHVARIQFGGTYQRVTPASISGVLGWGYPRTLPQHAIDNDLNTFYKPDTSTGQLFVVDLGSPQVLKSIRYHRQQGDNSFGGQFQGSNTPDFASPVTLATIHSAEAIGQTRQFEHVAVSNPNAYRYVRFFSPNSSNVVGLAEVQFYTGTTTPIDTNWDRMGFSRGLIAMGNLSVVGADKTDWVSLNGVSAGATSITLDAAPTGWRVGDKLVLTGTRYTASGSNADNTRFGDDVLTLTGISGNTITFTNNDTGANSLRFDHTVPSGHGLKVYLGNLTRNVVFETRDWQSGGAPSEFRGHTMVMGDGNVQIRNAAFHGLGRTNKSRPATDPDGTGTGSSYANVRGRYALHFHRMDNLSLAASAAVVDGSTVDDSTGWGFTNHSSKVDMNSNVSFDVLGSHFFTEEGDELGSFTNNLAIKATGAEAPTPGTGGPRSVDPVNPRAHAHDFGWFGNGYWLQGGGQMRINGNVAASTEGPAFEVYGNADDVHNGRIKFNPNNIADPAMRTELINAYGADNLFAWQVPWISFDNNIAFNAYSGFQYAWQLREAYAPRSPVRNVLDRFTAWGLNGETYQPVSQIRGGAGINFIYSGFLSVRNALLLGRTTSVSDPTTITGRKTVGIDVNYNIRSVTIENSTVIGFDQGVSIPFEGDQQGTSAPVFRDSRIVGGLFDNRVNLVPGERLVGAGSVSDPSFSYLELPGSPTFIVRGSNTAPSAAFNFSSGDGLAFRFDASTSSDPDPASYSGNKIAAYGWDFDSNGSIDAWGMKPTHTFTAAGSANVRLTVWDTHGATATTTRTVNVQPSQVNAVFNGDFASNAIQSTGFHPSSIDLLSRGPTWFTFDGAAAWTRDADGTLRAIANAGSAGIFQYQRDDRAHRGMQTIRFDFRNTEGSGAGNRLRMLVWGLNTHAQPRFGSGRTDVYSNTGSIIPQSFGTFPFTAVTLYDSGDVASSTTPWQTFSATADFGAGYDMLVIRFEQADVGSSDFLAIDNVSIQSASANPVLPPAAPSALSAAVSSTAVSLLWTDNATNETGFVLERATNSAFTAGLTSFNLAANTTSYNDTGLSASTTYWYRVRATNSAGASGNSNTASATTQGGGGTGLGLSATYYDNMDFTGATVTATEAVDFDWAGGSPKPGIGADTFSVRWEGEVQAVEAGSYTFRVIADDGVRLWVDGQQLVNAWVNQAPTTYTSAAVTFTAGQRKTLRVEYYENGGGAVARLQWQRPGQGTFVAIPVAQLYASASVTIPAAPSGLSATSASTSQINLAWTDNATNETGFVLERATNSTFTAGLTSFNLAANTTSYSDTGLSASTTYWYRVRATNSAGASGNANTASATTSSSGAIFADGNFAQALLTGSFTAGTSTLQRFYSQIGSGHSTIQSAGGNPGSHIRYGLYGSQVTLGLAAPSSAQTWRIGFDHLAPQSWNGPFFRVFGLTGGQVMSYADGGGVAGVQLSSQNPGQTTSWTARSYDVSIPSGYSVIVLQWWTNVGENAGLDNVSVSQVASGVPGDVDSDGVVAFSDVLIIAQHYGRTSGVSRSEGDVNGDGRVDFDDLLLLAQFYQG
jgi:hypothetical protein